jgi:hypothetical protein
VLVGQLGATDLINKKDEIMPQLVGQITWGNKGFFYIYRDYWIAIKWIELEYY